MFFQTFFQKLKNSPPGGGNGPQGDRQDPEQGVLTPADGGTQQEEVQSPARRLAQDQVQADLPVFQGQGAEEQGQADAEPEQQVQQRQDPAERTEQPEGPQQVIEKPQTAAGGQTEKQRGGLVGGRDPHPRNSRRKKPSDRSSDSS